MGRKPRPKFRAKEKATFVLMRDPPEPDSFQEKALKDVCGVTLRRPASQASVAPFPSTSSLSPLEELRATKKDAGEAPDSGGDQAYRLGVLKREAVGEILEQAETARYLDAVIRLLAVTGSVVEGRRATTVLPCQRALLDGLVALVRKYDEDLDDEITRARRVRLFDATYKAFNEILRLDAEGRSPNEQRARVAPSLAEALRDCYPLDGGDARAARLAQIYLDAREIEATAKESDGRGKAFTAAKQVVANQVPAGGKPGPSTVIKHAEESSGIEVTAYLEEADGDDFQQDLAAASLERLLARLRARRLGLERGQA